MGLGWRALRRRRKKKKRARNREVYPLALLFALRESDTEMDLTDGNQEFGDEYKDMEVVNDIPRVSWLKVYGVNIVRLLWPHLQSQFLF